MVIMKIDRFMFLKHCISLISLRNILVGVRGVFGGLLFLTALVLSSISAMAQTREVRGIVLDSAEQMPLIGASITAVRAGTTDTPESGGTITDLDGRFRLDIPVESAHLLIMYVGYGRVVVPCPGDFVTVNMNPETQEIEAVIVTGYGNIDRRKSTASVSSMMMDEKPKSTMSVDQMLQGQLAGVTVSTMSGTPGAPAKIRIRGTSSLQGTQDPLWVLDGMPLEGTELPKLEELANIDQLYSSSIAGVNPEDIESISVLRDAAATAIYGARAANGVIVINTKKGKQGTLRVNYAGKVSVIEKPNIKRLNLLNTDQKIDLELELLRSGFDYQEKKGEVSRILTRWGDLDAYKTGGLASLSAGARASLDSLRMIQTDWNDLLFRMALSQDHYVSLAGGGDRATYFVSVGYYDEAGTTVGVNASRYNLTAKTTFNFFDRVKIGVSVFGNERRNSSYLTNTDGFTNPAFYSRRANPYLSVYHADGSYVYDKDMQGFGRDGVTVPYNIYEERENTSNSLKTQSLTTLFDLEWRIWRGLTFDSQLGLQYDVRKNLSYADWESNAMRKDVVRSMRGSQSFLPQGGLLKNTAGHTFQYTLKNMLRYSHLFAEVHDVEVMVGQEIRRSEDETVFSAAYGYDPNTLTSEPLIYPDVSDALYFPQFKRNYYENAFVSFFGTASYTVLSRYTLGASIRFDGSNLFGVDPKYRYLPLYSVSAMWNAGAEPWLSGATWLSDLRFRASYGLQGNIDKSTSPKLIGEWATDATILPGGREKNIHVSRPPNARLRWERTATYNVGFDFSVWRHRYKLSFDYYHRKSTDLIGMRRLPLETGFEYTTINWSSLTNRGFEVNLGLELLRIGDFTWNMQGNFSFNENEIDRLTVQYNQRTPSGEGYPVGAIFVLPYAGIDEYGYPLLYNPQGEKVLISDLLRLTPAAGGSTAIGVSPAQEQTLYEYAGTDEPPYSVGLSMSWRWRGWELNASAVGNFGHKFLVTPYYSFIGYDRGLNTSAYILDRWTESNPNGTLPRLFTSKTLGASRSTEYGAYAELGYLYNLSLWVRDASYIRLQSVRLSYELPQQWVKVLHLQRISLSVEGRNLLVYGFDYEGFLDPETMKNPFAQPIPRSVTFGLNVGF